MSEAEDKQEKKSNDMYEQAKKDFESRKEQIATDEKENFLQDKKKKPQNFIVFILIGVFVLGAFYAMGTKEKKESDAPPKRDGLLNTLGEAPKVREKIEKPDLTVKEEAAPAPVIQKLPPLPEKVDKKSEWFARKMNKTKVSEFSSTNEKAEKKDVRTAPTVMQGEKVNSSDYQSPFEESESSLSASLKPTVTPSVNAGILPNRDYLITKGTSIDCTLVNAIDTSVEGFITCRTSHDVYSESGRVLLVEKGSKVVGEYRSIGRNMGEPRLFILWSRLTTPMGVAVELNSAGTDSLGRAGVGGDVDNFWFKRFGAAFMTSIMQDSLQILNTQLSNNSKNSSGVQVSTDNTMRQSEKLIEELLAQSRGIMPRLVKNQGEIVRIYVSRDINFDQVYRLTRQ